MSAVTECVLNTSSVLIGLQSKEAGLFGREVRRAAGYGVDGCFSVGKFTA